jgi:hypothetical protein
MVFVWMTEDGDIQIEPVREDVGDLRGKPALQIPGNFDTVLDFAYGLIRLAHEGMVTGERTAGRFITLGDEANEETEQ